MSMVLELCRSWEDLDCGKIRENYGILLETLVKEDAGKFELNLYIG